MFSIEDLRILKNQNIFFERVERFMLETHPYRCLKFGKLAVIQSSQGYHAKASFFQLTPIMNIIEDLLSLMLQDLEKLQNTSESPINEYQSTFTRAANLYSRIMIELGLPKQVISFLSENIPCSYLTNLVGFLKYTRDPFYVLRVCDTLTRFAFKMQKEKKSTQIEPFLEFCWFAMPFLTYFKESGFNIDHLLARLTSDLISASSQNSSHWSSQKRALSKIFPEKSYEIENLLLDKIPMIPTNVSADQRFAAAGEICFLTLIKSSDSTKPRNYEISAIASAAYEVLRKNLRISLLLTYFRLQKS